MNTSINNVLTAIIQYHVGFKYLLHCYAILSNKLFHYKGTSSNKLIVLIFVETF